MGAILNHNPGIPLTVYTNTKPQRSARPPFFTEGEGEEWRRGGGGQMRRGERRGKTGGGGGEKKGREGRETASTAVNWING